MKDLLTTFQKRLTNLSVKNRSLLLLRLLSDQFIDIHAFDFIENQSSFKIIEELLAGKNGLLCKEADSRNEAGNQLSLRLKRISRIDRYIEEEQGSKDLYVGWPFVRGKFSDGTSIRCPLLLFPVEILLENGEWKIAGRSEIIASINKSFLLAYAHYNNIELDEELLDIAYEDKITDSRLFRTKLYQLLKDSNLEINFNQENFLDALTDFINYKKPDFNTAHKDGELKLFPEAVIGIFPQSGSQLTSDYEQLIEEDQYPDLEQFFVDRSIDEEKVPRENSFQHFLQEVKEEETFTPFMLDSYQENAIKAVKKGNSVVVQGPPGTGKSQLICNLISDFAARGKKVLLVCQKRAALDVVYQRLKEMEMGRFVGLVHDFKNDRKALYDQISRQIERIDEFKLMNNSLDSIQLERKFLQASRKIDQIAEELEEFKYALFDESEAGVSVKELYLTSDPSQPSINVKQEYTEFKIDNLDPLLNKLKIYIAYHQQFDRENYTWKNRKKFAGYSFVDLQTMRDMILDIPKFQEVISSEIFEEIGHQVSLQEAVYLAHESEPLVQMLEYIIDEPTFDNLKHMLSNAEYQPNYLALLNTEKNFLACFENEGPELHIKKEKLGQFQEILQDRKEAGKNILLELHWRIFSKNKRLVKKVLANNNLTTKRKDIKILERMVDNRLNLEHNLTKLKEYKWLRDVPDGYSLQENKLWFLRQKNAVQAYEVYVQYRILKEFLSIVHLKSADFKKKIRDIVNVVNKIPVQWEKWNQYFRDARIENLLNDPTLAEKMVEVLNKDFDSLVDFDNLKSKLAPSEKSIIDKLLENEEFESEEDILQLLQNSLRLAWLEYIESKYPVLRSVSSMRFEFQEKELQDAILEKFKLSQEIVLMKLRESTYHKLEYNRLNNLVTYRELEHQVRKKRKIWPIRKIFQQYDEQIFKLIPCWLASPETVSAIFPMKQMFDLVIFDEASQCFVERGIPAMYRGNRVLVAGDDKQLNPFDLYKVRWDDESEPQSMDLEIDSLLNISEKYLLQVKLQGHYRSKSLDLIDFSNQYFYDGNLKLLPNMDVINQNKPAIEYQKVDGLWHKMSNEAEATHIAKKVKKLISEGPEKEIGVITFNARQQELVMDKIDELLVKKGVAIPDSFFVKNIENVQGDEKDIIIFSIGYAPDSAGHMRHHFGLLNLPGGENRLNVAITRAREKVIVVSSIWPDQLQTEELKNNGPKVLKKYLSYALQVSKGKFEPCMKENTTHHQEWYLKSKIKVEADSKNYNFKLEEDMPFADLSVKQNKKEYSGLLLTDDEHYHNSISIKDLHAYLPFAMSYKGWKHKTVYSRSFWHDKDILMEKLLRFNDPDKSTKDG